MNLNHNRIKVSDLEKNQPNKILTTNNDGELEFSNISDIQVDSYNALDYTQEGKALDARQGKILKDMIENNLKSQITINTGTNNITTDTLDYNGLSQQGRNVIINNGINPISITVNGGLNFCASYLKHGKGAITFIAGNGRNLILVNGVAVLNGIEGSTATISSIGTTDYLRISN